MSKTTKPDEPVDWEARYKALKGIILAADHRLSDKLMYGYRETSMYYMIELLSFSSPLKYPGAASYHDAEPRFSIEDAIDHTVDQRVKWNREK